MEQAQKMDAIAKHNIVVMALLTQTEAQKQSQVQKQNEQSEESTKKEISTGHQEFNAVKPGSQAVQKPTGQATQWQVNWDYSLHKFFPVIKLNK